MSAFAATGWTFATTLGFILLWGIAVSLRDGAKHDIVTQALSQLIAYSLGLFAVLRFHAPNAGIRQFLGLRATSVIIYPLAFLLGLALTLPTNKLYELTIARFPLEGESGLQAMWDEGTRMRRVLIVVLVAGLGPIIEETLFRGALFTPLRRVDGEAARPSTDGSSAWRAIAITSALFVVVHLAWQQFLPLAIVAVVLGLMRWKTGSILPAMLLHMGYNAIPFIAELALPDVETIPLSWALGGSVVAALLLAMILTVCRGSRAATARDEEL